MWGMLNTQHHIEIEISYLYTNTSNGGVTRALFVKWNVFCDQVNQTAALEMELPARSLTKVFSCTFLAPT